MNNCLDYSGTVIAPIIDPHSGITLKWKTSAARPAYFNAAYPGTPDVGICAMGGMIGSSRLTGVLMPSGECWVALADKQFNNRGSRQQYVSAIDGVEWKASGGGNIPVYAIPTGFREAQQWGNWPGAKTAYICRTKFYSSRERRDLTRVGWTIDGKTCSYAYYADIKATTFEVLARQPAKSYQLRLDDFWPVPKKGVWYPGLAHVLAKKHEIKKVVHAVTHAVEHEARKIIPHVHIRFHHHHHHHWY